MARISKKYALLGLRRDRNLSDLDNPTIALNNLLNNIETIPGQTFITDDLDALRGQKNSGITRDRLVEIANTTARYTDAEGNSQLVSPALRIKDKVENIKIVTGDTPAIQGGTGLMARFIASPQINAGTQSSTGSTIFTILASQPQEVFWNRGFTEFLSTMHTSFIDQSGGIQWTGYLSPDLYDPLPRMFFETTGLVMIEYDAADNNSWTVLRSIYAGSRVLSVSTTSNTTTVTLSAGQGKFAAVGDIVAITPAPATPVEVTAITGDVLTLSAAHSVTANGTITLEHTLGETTVSGTCTFNPVAIGNYIHIRISLWWPIQSTSYNERRARFRYKTVDTELTYPHLYASKPPAAGPDEVRTFLGYAVSPYQRNLGESGNNKGFYIGNTFKITYSPKSSIDQIKYIGPVNVSFLSSSPVATSSVNLDSVPVGSYVVPTLTDGTSKITEYIQVSATSSSTVKVLTKSTGFNVTESVNFVDHQGFIGWFRATSSGTTVTLPTQTYDNSIIRTNYIVVAPGTGLTSFVRVTGKISTNQFTTSAALNLTGTQIIYIYSDKGLVDTSKDDFCTNVFGRVLSATVNVGATSFVVTDATGIVAGQVVQYSTNFTSGATVGSVAGTTVTLTAGHSVQTQILKDSTIVFAPSGTTINKEGCVIPLNTAPPFEGTFTGLSAADFGIRTTRTTLAVNANSLSLTIPNGYVVAAPSGTLTFNRRITINTSYSILGNTI